MSNEKQRIRYVITNILAERGYQWDESNAEIIDVQTNEVYRVPSITLENLYDSLGMTHVNTRIVVGDYRVGHKSSYYKVNPKTGDYNFNKIVDVMINKRRCTPNV